MITHCEKGVGALSIRWQEIETEPVGQHQHVPAIPRARRVPGVVFELQGGAEARNDAVEDLSDREPLGGIGAVRAVRRRPDLPPGPVFVEDDGMKIDVPAIGSMQDNTNRGEILCDGEIESGEAFVHFGEIVQLDHEIDIAVNPGDLTKQRVNTPSAIDPDPQVPCLEFSHNRQNLVGAHHIDLSHAVEAGKGRGALPCGVS
jgi:hypothetical protein